MAAPPYGANSNIFLVEFPITEDTEIRNIFHGFVKNEIVLAASDSQQSTAITQQGSGIRVDDGQPNQAYIVVNGYLTIVDGLYAGQTGLITAVGTNTIDVAITYIGNDSGVQNYFFNRLNNDYHLQYRFMISTAEDEQDGIPFLIESIFNVYQDKIGYWRIDLSMVADLFVKGFDFVHAAASENPLNLEFQCQIIEIENNEQIDTWETVKDSVITFKQFILAHATGTAAQFTEYNEFLETDFVHRAWRGYPVLYNFVSNESGAIGFEVVEYNQARVQLIGTNPSVYVLAGVSTVTYTITEASTRYIQIVDTEYGNEFIDFVLYETNEDETEYFVKWLAQPGGVRSWLFTAQVEIDESFKAIEYNFGATPIESEKIISVVADGLSAEELNYIKDIYGTNLIQVTNDSIDYNCRLGKSKISYDNQLNTYAIEVELSLETVEVMNV